MKFLNQHNDLFSSVLSYVRNELTNGYAYNDQLVNGFLNSIDPDEVMPIMFMDCTSEHLPTSKAVDEFLTSRLADANQVVVITIPYGQTTVSEGWFIIGEFCGSEQYSCISSIYFDNDANVCFNPRKYQEKLIDKMVYQSRKLIAKESAQKAASAALKSPHIRIGNKIKDITISGHKAATLTITELLNENSNPLVAFTFTKRGTRSRYEGQCCPSVIVRAIQDRDNVIGASEAMSVSVF